MHPASHTPEQNSRTAWTGVAAPTIIATAPLAVLSIVYFVLPALAPQLVAAANVTPSDYGWLAGSVGLGSVTFYLLSHAITPVVGPLGTLRLGVLFGFCGLTLILTGSWPAMIAGGFLVGIGYGTSTPAGSQILADFTPRALWGTLFSIRQAGVPLGGIVAGGLAALSLAPHGWSESLVYCLLVVGMLGVFLLAAPAALNSARPLQPFVLSELVTPRNLVKPFRNVAAVSGLPTLVAAGCGFSMVHGAVTTFFVLYLYKAHSFDMRDAALLFSVLQGTAVIGRIVFGAIADRLKSQLTVLRFLAPLSAISALTLANFEPTWSHAAQLAAVVSIGLTVGTWNGLYLAEIARRVPANAVGSATASAAVFGFLTYAATPPLFGALIVTIGWSHAFTAIAMAAVFAGLALTVLKRRNPMTASA